MMSVLPEDFDGVFRFTNFTDSDFKARWNNIEYTFPAQKMTPLLIPGATPEEVQNIRKKFAKELAIEVFYKSKKLKELDKMNPVGQTGFHSAVTYNETDLAEFTQRCLEPLPVAKATVKALPKTSNEDSFRKDDEGKPVTRILKNGESLLAQGSAEIE